MLGPLMNSIHVKDKLYIRDLKFIYNMKISDNKLAQSCFSFACSDANSIIGNKIAYFRSEYNISVTKPTVNPQKTHSQRPQTNCINKCNI